MSRTRLTLGVMLILAVTFLPLRAQEKPKPDAKAPSATLKVQITITENEGEKKVGSLPYTFFLKAGGLGESWSAWTKVRMGSRVPVYVSKDGGMQYIDVGTNIDSRAMAADEGRFDLAINLERSWVEGDVLLPVEKVSGQSPDTHSGQFREPVIRQFKTELTLTMRDGQTIQSTMATDPLSGKVLTVNVSMNVVK